MPIKKCLLAHIPHLPGCYLFKGKNKEVLYVGKAKDLQKRVSQYWDRFDDLDPKIKKMFSEAEEVEVIDVGSEIEALILEANLIKKYRPKYNTILKDDKNYSWVVVTREEYPRVYKTRKVDLNSKDLILGPYPNSGAISQTLRFLQTVFPYRSCRHKIPIKEPHSCLYYHISKCGRICDGTISKSEYLENIKNIILFFRSKKKRVIERLQKEMREASNKHEYEKAARLRDQIEALDTISKKIYVTWGQDEYDVYRSNLQRARAGLLGLVSALRKRGVAIKIPKGKEVDSFRIECYDISNIFGKEAAGSMVVFIGGVPEKSHYRRFRIKSEGNNDYQMLQEVFSRRFAHIVAGSFHHVEKDSSFSSLPDLIIVDGGKGQRSAAEKILLENHSRLCVDIPVVGLSKRREELWIKNNKYPLRFKDGADELFLLQRIRDEAHRFAIAYHRKLRVKRLFGG